MSRAAGVALIAIGLFALTAPMAVGQWSLALLGIPVIVLSVIEAYSAFMSPRRADISAYVPGALALVAGNLLLLSSALVLDGLLILLIAILTFDGIAKILSVGRGTSLGWTATVLNGLIDFGSAALLWYLSRIVGPERAIGIIVAIFILATGWRMVMTPLDMKPVAAVSSDPKMHPDAALGLPEDETFSRLQQEIDNAAPAVRSTTLLWMLTLVGVFFAIHAGRMPTSDTVLGMISPVVATIGDVLMTVGVAAAVVLPFRLLLRRLTRPLERLAWSISLKQDSSARPRNPIARWFLTNWLSYRFSFTLRLRKARTSLLSALILLLYLGLPLTAFFVAFNPVWGFSWYFNSESWASAVYQKRLRRW
jgi:uncharacterized membrane protein HdeD (DUF308 family)